MNDLARIRSVELGEYIVKNRSTVRAAAKVFGISKSTVHTDVTQKLEEIDPVLSKEVRGFEVRNLRTGLVQQGFGGI